jgi:SAM-dependent methyltransferase
LYAFFHRDDHGVAPADSPERWAKFVQAIGRNSGWMGLANEPEFRLLEPFLRNGGRILEVGCGPGYWARFLCHLGYNAEGLDFSDDLIRELKVVAPQVPWHLGDIRSMQFPDATFSLLLCWGVVEHFEGGPHEALAELHRVLTPGGTCFVSVPYLNRWRQLTFRGTTNFSPGRTVFSQNYFRAEELKDSMSRTGFKDIRLIPIGRHLEVAMPFLRRLKPRLLRTVLNRLLVWLFPGEVSSHMLLAIAQKDTTPVSGTKND